MHFNLWIKRIVFLAGGFFAAAALPQALSANTLASKRVLFVDDQRTAIMRMEVLLKSLGMDRIETALVTTALPEFALDAYDIIITDYHLRDFRGSQFAGDLRRRGVRVPIFLYSGLTTEKFENLPPAEKFLFAGFIEKHQNTTSGEAEELRQVLLEGIKVKEFSGRNLLLIDDNLELVNALGEILVREFGFSVEGFTDPAAALERVRGGVPFDFGIVDLEMPKMDGITLGLAIHQFNPATPLLLWSANTERMQTLNLAHSPFAATTTKYSNLSTLRRSMAELFRQYIESVCGKSFNPDSLSG